MECILELEALFSYFGGKRREKMEDGEERGRRGLFLVGFAFARADAQW